MKRLGLSQMEQLTAGDASEGFCFGIATAIAAGAMLPDEVRLLFRQICEPIIIF